MKLCTTCNEVKPFTDFHTSKRRADGYQSVCIECRAWRHKLRAYGVTQEQYEEMYAEQGGKCPLCGRPHAKLCIDHDHVTGRVRGLLCLPCNRSLGYYENAEWRRRARSYLAL